MRTLRRSLEQVGSNKSSNDKVQAAQPLQSNSKKTFTFWSKWFCQSALMIPLLSLSVAAYGQENCTNSIDDDADGLIDCADTDCSGIPYPSANSFATGQGAINSADPNWQVSSILYAGTTAQTPATLPLPNASGVTYSTAFISQNCAPGAWVEPSTLPPPLNNSNWITHAVPCVQESDRYVYRYYRRAFRLPCSCGGANSYPVNNLIYQLDGYSDNIILAIYINGVNISAPGLPHGGFTLGAQGTLVFPGPWNAGDNTIEVLLANDSPPTAGQEGLLLTASQSGASTFPIPTPVFTPSSSTICNGESTTLNASSSTGLNTYLWNTGATTSSITVSPNVTTNYMVTLTSSNSCTASAQTTVTVNPTVTLTAAAAPTSICNGQANTTLTATPSGGAGFTYVWSNAAGSSQSVVVSPNTTTTCRVTVTNANGCTGTAQTTVTVNPAVTVTAAAAPTSICNGQANTTLTATPSGGAGFTYAWSNAAGSAQSVVVSPSTNTTYIITVTNSNGCTGTAQTTVTVNAVPLACIQENGSNVCGTTICNRVGGITLTGTGGASYSWSTGATSASLNVSPTAVTNYRVTVTSSLGCTATSGVTVSPLGTGSCGLFPLAINDINNTLQNTSVSGNVITNDESLVSGVLVATAPVRSPVNGTVVLNSNGTYNYTPTNGFIGRDSFQYQVCNPGPLCDIATVYINVTTNTVANNPPVPSNDIIQTLVNTPVGGTVASNDIDPDGNIDPNGFTLVTPPSSIAGTVMLSPNGVYSFTPATGFTGITYFVYQVCDLGSPILCAIATAVIEVLPDTNGPANDPPNAQDDAGSTSGTRTILGNALANDSDPNGNGISVTNVGIFNITGGTISISSNGAYSFTPTAGFTGTSSFIYTICDNGSPSLCDQATIYLTVLNCALQAGACIQQVDGCQLGQGQIRIQAQGGMLPYRVSWTPSDGTPVSPQFITSEGGALLISGLIGSTYYQFAVTDANGCTAP